MAVHPSVVAVNWAEAVDQVPQRIWEQRGGHTRSRYLAEGDQVSEVLLHALIEIQTIGYCHVRHFRHSTQSQGDSPMSDGRQVIGWESIPTKSNNGMHLRQATTQSPPVA